MRFSSLLNSLISSDSTPRPLICDCHLAQVPTSRVTQKLILQTVIRSIRNSETALQLSHDLPSRERPRLHLSGRSEHMHGSVPLGARTWAAASRLGRRMDELVKTMLTVSKRFCFHLHNSQFSNFPTLVHCIHLKT